MEKNNKILGIAAKVIAILYTIFISIFALDALHEQYWVIALYIHLIPTYILVLVILFAWRWPLPGGLLFWSLGFFYLWISGGKMNPVTYLIMLTPLFLAGLLLIIQDILDRKYARKKQEGRY